MTAQHIADLLIAAAVLDVRAHTDPHLRAVADRLGAEAARLHRTEGTNHAED